MKEYITKDADEAAYLWLQNICSLDRVEKDEGFRKPIIFFVFLYSCEEEIFHQLIDSFRNGNSLVEPKSFAWKRSEIRRIIHENLFDSNQRG